ncbi:MAG TPA: hypothetical protein VFR23_19595 [Jiangellaceae bacterium]|nr:hypothetical protein [Jiangellaceae bacterium]
MTLGITLWLMLGAIGVELGFGMALVVAVATDLLRGFVSSQCGGLNETDTSDLIVGISHMFQKGDKQDQRNGDCNDTKCRSAPHDPDRPDAIPEE